MTDTAIQTLDRVETKMFTLIESVENGTLGTAEGDVIARAGYTIVKGQEVRLLHRLRAKKDDS